MSGLCEEDLDYDPWDGKTPLIGASGGGAEVNVNIIINLHAYGDSDPAKAAALGELIEQEVRRAVTAEARTLTSRRWKR